MDTPEQLEQKFWKALKSDRTLMLGVDGVEDGHSRPMTAQVEGERGPIWFFTGKPNAVVDNDRAVIDRLWNPFIAAWFDGKDDPKLVLLRFDAEHAEVWLNENSLLAGVKMLLGVDPKRDYADKNAEVDLT